MNWINGKKTLIGVLVVALPTIFDSLTQIISAAGGGTDDFVRITGAIVAVLGLVHKFFKGSE